MIAWEYCSYLFEPGERLIGKMNDLGAKGWEAFHFESGAAKGSTKVHFKRKTEPQPPAEQSK